jgi:hypothetical protein
MLISYCTSSLVTSFICIVKVSYTVEMKYLGHILNLVVDDFKGCALSICLHILGFIIE